jgi:hypothetical protein
MTKELSMMLELAFGSPKNPAKIKNHLASALEQRKELYAFKDGGVESIAPAKVRELILSESVERAGLVQTEIYNTVVSGSKAKVCMRDAFPVAKMNTDVMNVPVGNAFIYAPLVAEGAELPSIYQNYTSKTLTAKKYGNKIPISHELVQDAKFDLVGIELEKTGAGVENKLNQLMLTALLDGAGNEHDCAGSNVGITAVIGARKLVEEDGFYPDTLIMHPSAYAQVLTDYKPAYNWKAEDVLQSGVIPDVIGLKPFVTNVADDSSTYTWGYGTDSYIGMVVADSKSGGIIGMREDISVEMHDDPFKMLVAPIVWARFDSSALKPSHSPDGVAYRT